MAYFGNVPPPSCLGFVRNPNLVLPPYITTEVHLYRDEAGSLVTHRRPRPLSIIAGAEFVLQCDQDKLARYQTLFPVYEFDKKQRERKYYY